MFDAIKVTAKPQRSRLLADAGRCVGLRVKAWKAVSATRIHLLNNRRRWHCTNSYSTNVNERQRINVSDKHSTPGVQAKL